jgi:hypothetical protein
MSAFEFGENDKISAIALIAKANAVDKSMDRHLIYNTLDSLTRRLTTEKVQVMNTMKIKLVDNIMRYAPHFSIRPITDIGVSSVVTPKPLVVLVDSSGSMSSVIKSMQQNLKQWIDQRLHDGTYCGCTLIFFGSNVHGPFYDTNCLNVVHESGGTSVVPALRALQHTLKGSHGSDVIFITDGDFNEGKSAYDFGLLDNIENFVMVFPDHTPQNTVIDHYAYLPRITKPNTPVYSVKKESTGTFDSILSDKLTESYKVHIERTLYTPICGEYLMLTGLSLFQMNSIVNLILQYPQEDSALVHNFFSYIMGVYNAMATKGGDLLNTLRSEEMKLLWQLLQPLKKTLQQVNPTNIHYSTTSLVYDFLESYEGEIVGKRDARIAELKKRGNTKEIQDEIANIKKSFECMKRVDEYDRIMIDIEKLKARGHSSIHVKYNYRANISSDAFKGFPNLSRADMTEIYKMIGSIGLTNKTDPNALELVLDPEGSGLILVLRLLTYKKTDESKITLTATLVSRMMFGFFATQILGGYVHTDDHDKIKLLLWKHTMNFSSQAILFNMTNTSESSNTAPEWIKILNTISLTTDISVQKTPPDMTLWTLNPNDSSKWILNSSVLNSLATKNSALFAYRVIQGFGSRLSTQVSTRYYVNIPKEEIPNFILKVSGKEQQWYEWRDLPLKTLTLSSGEVLIITNGMDLQDGLHIHVDDFLQRHFESGHRLINKAGVSHPATTYGTGLVKQSVHAWFMNCWQTMLEHYKDELGHLAKYKFPTVITDQEFNQVKCLIELALISHPYPSAIYYDKLHTEPTPAWLITQKAEIFDEDFVNIVASISNIPDFNKATGEQQVKLVQKLEKEQNGLFCDVPEIIENATTLALELRSKFQPIEVITGIGFNVKPRKQINKLLTILESSDFNLDEFLSMSPEDSISVEDFCCPISGDIFENPIMFDGHVYEKSSLEQWFKTSRSSPLTRRTHGDDGKILELINPPTVFMSALNKYKTKLSNK